MRVLLSLFLLAAAAGAEDLAVGYRLSGLQYEGPGEWRHADDPIWVYDYHTLRLTYRASGLPRTDTPILTLRPGAAGPVTPGAANPENPFAAGQPLVAATAADLVADGAAHTLEIELRGKTRTAQVDQLRFSLPVGARLSIAELQFRGEPDVFPCAAGGPALPADARRLAARGPSNCGAAAATSLRGRESIRIEGGGARGAALYLSLTANLAGVSSFEAAAPFERWRPKETTETASVLVRVQYADGTAEEEFPLLLAQRRHVLLNRTPSLYAIALDPARAVASVELLDRSPHVQLALFAAGLSQTAPPAAADETLAAPAPARRPAGAPSLQGSPWFQVRAAAGKPPLPPTLRADLQVKPAADGQSASLSVTNTGAGPQEFTLSFPSLTIAPAAGAADVYYLFPAQRAIVGREEKTLEAVYSGAFPLQFVDVFAPAANAGAAVIVRDTKGAAKNFRLRKTGATVAVDVEYAVRLAPGETFRPPDVQVRRHGGGWHEGFAAYRQWVATWYRPKGPRPAWLRSAFWARRDYPIGGSGHLYDVRTNRYTFDDLLHDGEALGGTDFIDISGWALSNTVGRVGDYPIELGGAADLRRNIASALERNIPTGLYFEGYLIDKNSQVGRRHGTEWQIAGADGKPRWWAGGSSELFACPFEPAWQQYLSGRVAAVAGEVGAAAIYLDEFGFGNKRCYATTHHHPAGAWTMEGEFAMVRAVRQALDAAGRSATAIYIEETPPDAAAPYYDAAFCYALPFARQAQPAPKLNLWRFAFPDIRLWDMLTVGVHPRELSSEDFRLSLWHGNGVWLKGHTESWYGEDVLRFLGRAHALLRQHAAAFAGAAEPLVESPHPSIFVNRFTGGGEVVHTLFNASYRTVSFAFQGRNIRMAPREVEVVASAQ
jgi:hypothetical protein